LQRFSRQFLLSLGILAPALIAGLIVWTRVTAEPQPKPPYPVPGRQFVAEYGVVGADAAHIVYYWGLFGIGRRIRQAQLLLLGSSHMQFGLSARQLSVTLSRTAGKPVEAFNLGVGCGESALFGARVLQRLGIRGKTTVADIYNTDSLSPCGGEAVKADAYDAYFKVLAIWTKFTWDWLLDGYLPTLMLRDGSATVSRFLSGSIVIVDWRYGDVAYCSRPSQGKVFPQDARGAAYPVDDYSGNNRSDLPPTVPADPKLLDLLAAGQMEPALTLIPFSGSRDYRPKLPAPHSKGGEASFIELSGQGLATFDHNHLTGDSRAVATQRLLDTLSRDGLLSALLAELPATTQRLMSHWL